MNLRSRIAVTLGVVVAAYAVLDHMVQRVALRPSFEALESNAAAEDLDRGVRAIHGEIVAIDQRCRAAADADEVLQLVSQATSGSGTLGGLEDPLRNLGCELILIANRAGKVLHRVQIRRDSNVPFSLEELPNVTHLDPSHSWLVGENAPRGKDSLRGYSTGIALTEHGPLLLASRPVLPTPDSQDVLGSVVLGKFLDQELIADLGRKARIRLFLWPLTDPELPPQDRALVDSITASEDYVVRAGDDSILRVYTTLNDLRKSPALLLRVDVPREITAQSDMAIRYGFFSTLASGLLLLVVLVALLQRIVLNPIATLTEHAVNIARSEDTTGQLGFSRRDEIGILSREFDSMIGKLAQSRLQVVDAARAAGKSEIATGILHNVGNVLNSVNVSIAMVSERVRDSKVEKLDRVVKLLEDHKDELGTFLTSDARGKHVTPYLIELSKLMLVDHEEIRREVSGLQGGIDHIRELVTSQQSYAGLTGPKDPIKLATLVEDALRISRQAGGLGDSVEIVRRFEEVPSIRVERHKVTEILINLIKNAIEATRIGAARDPRVSLEIKRVAPDRVCVAVSDNGMGIAPENLTRIFTHGFTTKPKGHGFGLHASANAATELDGSLTVKSDGLGQGATFELELPLGSQEERA